MANKTDTLTAAAQGLGCLGKSEPGEPVFVLCARDRFAPMLVDLWAQLVESAKGGSSDKTRQAFDVAASMRAWQHASQLSGGKVPD